MVLKELIRSFSTTAWVRGLPEDIKVLWETLEKPFLFEEHLPDIYTTRLQPTSQTFDPETRYRYVVESVWDEQTMYLIPNNHGYTPGQLKLSYGSRRATLILRCSHYKRLRSIALLEVDAIIDVCSANAPLNPCSSCLGTGHATPLASGPFEGALVETERSGVLGAFRKIASLVPHDSEAYQIAAEYASVVAHEQRVDYPRISEGAMADLRRLARDSDGHLGRQDAGSLQAVVDAIDACTANPIAERSALIQATTTKVLEREGLNLHTTKPDAGITTDPSGLKRDAKGFARYDLMTDAECCKTGYHRRKSNEACECGYKEGRPHTPTTEAEMHDEPKWQTAMRRAVERENEPRPGGGSRYTAPDPLAHFRGVAGTVSVRAVESTGPWRLFLGTHGVADWPSKAAIEDPEGYASEVARCVNLALDDEVHGPRVQAKPTLKDIVSYLQDGAYLPLGRYTNHTRPDIAAELETYFSPEATALRAANRKALDDFAVECRDQGVAPNECPKCHRLNEERDAVNSAEWNIQHALRCDGGEVPRPNTPPV